ncbi:MAG: diacylglycerol kinase family protein [Bacteroidota bacterium]
MEKDQPDWHFLVNPAASRGKTKKEWQRLLPKLQQALPQMTWAESTEVRGLSELAQAAVRAGRRYLVGVGGDGTHHDILNGIVTAGGLDVVTYAPLPRGTGNDWVRSLKVPRDLQQWLKNLRSGNTITQRVGALCYLPTDKTTDQAKRKTTYFLNVAGMAYDALVVRLSEQATFKHRFIYPSLTLLYLRKFLAPEVRIDYNGTSFTGLVHTVNFGIGKYSGGGMQLVPHAELDADALALTFARKLPVWKILKESWRFYTGGIGALPEVTTVHTECVTVTPISGVAELEADGEWLGRAPVEVGLLEGRLRVAGVP